MGFKVWGLGFRGLRFSGFQVWGLGFGGLRFRGFGCEVLEYPLSKLHMHLYRVLGVGRLIVT